MAIQGITEGNEPSKTIFQLIDDKHQVIFTKVFPQLSRIKLMEGYPKNQSFAASLLERATPN